MAEQFGIVKDSSIWHNPDTFNAIHKRDPYIRVGIIKKVYRDKSTSDLRYLVEARDTNDTIQLNCRMLRKFGGAFNYEDTIYHGYKIDDKPDPVQAFDAKAGDIVLVVGLNGQARESVIIGCLSHPARTSTIPIDKGPYYQSEFNGIETVINENGEYKLTFKAIPKNIKKLDDKPSKRLPKPEYDTDIGGSFLWFDKTGSFEVNDKAKENPQSLRIDKKNGTIQISSGKINIKMTKKEEKIDVKCKILNIVSDDKIDQKTKDYKLEASSSTKIKSPKIAIGKDGTELLDQLAKLVDALGKVTPISPVGPCTPLQSTPQWSEVASIQSKIKEITGSL